MPKIHMRPAASAIAAINADSELKNLEISVQSIGQVVIAGILGTSVSRLEEAVRYNIPFVLDKANRDDGTELMPWQHQLNDAAMVQRASEIVRAAAAKKSNLGHMSSVELDFTAQRVVSHVKDRIIEQGLHIYPQKWLFDTSRPLNDRLSLLKAMTNPHFGPQSASTAIASGLMPRLPAYSVPDFVRMLDASWIGSTFQVPNRNLHDWIALREPYLVEFPLPSIAAGKAARTDSISRSTGSEKIEFGLGFMLVEVDEKFDQFCVVTPMLFAHRTAAESVPKYSKGYVLKSYSRAYAKEYKQLADLLRNPGSTKVARLLVCPDCGAIYSKDHVGLPHTSCAS